MWASAVEYSNDSLEVRLGFKLLAEAALEKIKQAQGAEHAVLTSLLEWLDVGKRPFPNVFFVSFSLRGDLLSQWRGYTPNEGGICLALNRAELETCAHAQGFEVVECIYDVSKQRELVAERLEDILDCALQSAGPTTAIQPYVKAFQQVYPSLLRLFGSFKSPMFSEEDEYRLLLVHDYRSGRPVKYRASPATIIPYVEFELPVTPKGMLSYGACGIGPGRHASLTRNSISAFLRSENVDNLYVYLSQVSLVR